MNRLRVIAIFFLVLVAVAGALPVTESLAKWSRRSASAQRKRPRKHTRAWWRRHRALMRARRARAEQRRRLAAAAASRSGAAPRINTALLTFDANAGAPVSAVPAISTATLASAPARATLVRTSALLPFAFTPPHNWSAARKGRAGAAVFSVTTPDGRGSGTAVVAPVSLSAAELAGSPTGPKTKSVGGLPVTALRRTVIDRMVAEGGWVTNDFVQEMQGRRVFVVHAQTGAPGAPAQSWAFYFTEVDGRVYSLATTGPVEFAAPLAAGSAQFMASLQPAASRNAASQR
ncbi:MAG: hypothetical protein LC795_17860 [Acidobacteria bacterium]|nr:hypothetical protein [Acidobacteriota bacterium]